MDYRDDAYKLALGNFFKEHREKNNLTQAEIAENFGFSTCQFISNMERGKSAIPMYVIAELTKIYSIPGIEFVEFILNLEKSFWERHFKRSKGKKTPKDKTLPKKAKDSSEDEDTPTESF